MIRIYDLLPLIIRLKDAQASGSYGIEPILARVTDRLLQDEFENHVALLTQMRTLMDCLQVENPYRALLFQLLGQSVAEGWQESLERFFLQESVPWHKISGTCFGWKKSLGYRASEAYDFHELFKSERNETDDYSPVRNGRFPLRAARVAFTPAGYSPYDWSSDTIITVDPYIPQDPYAGGSGPGDDDGDDDGGDGGDGDPYDGIGEDNDPYAVTEVFDLTKVDAGSRRSENNMFGSAVATAGEWGFVGTAQDNAVHVFRQGVNPRSWVRTQILLPTGNEIQTIEGITGGSGSEVSDSYTAWYLGAAVDGGGFGGAYGSSDDNPSWQTSPPASEVFEVEGPPDDLYGSVTLTQGDLTTSISRPVFFIAQFYDFIGQVGIPLVASVDTFSYTVHRTSTGDVDVVDRRVQLVLVNTPLGPYSLGSAYYLGVNKRKSETWADDEVVTYTWDAAECAAINADPAVAGQLAFLLHYGYIVLFIECQVTGGSPGDEATAKIDAVENSVDYRYTPEENEDPEFFTLTVPGFGETTTIPENASAGIIAAALEDVVGVGNINATGGPLPEKVFVEFIGELAGRNIGEMTTDSSVVPNTEFLVPSKLSASRTDYTNLIMMFDFYADSGLPPALVAGILANPSAYTMRFELSFIAGNGTTHFLATASTSVSAGADTLRGLLIGNFNWLNSDDNTDLAYTPAQLIHTDSIEVTGGLSTSVRVRFVGLFNGWRASGTIPYLKLVVYNTGGVQQARFGEIQTEPTGAGLEDVPADDYTWYDWHKLKFIAPLPESGLIRLRVDGQLTPAIDLAIPTPVSGILKERFFGWRMARAINRTLSRNSPPIPDHVVFYGIRLGGGLGPGSDADVFTVAYPVTAAGLLTASFEYSLLGDYVDMGIRLLDPFFPVERLNNRSGIPNTTYNPHAVLDYPLIFTSEFVERTYRDRADTNDPLDELIADLSELASLLNEGIEGFWYSHVGVCNVWYYDAGYHAPQPSPDDDEQYRVVFNAGCYVGTSLPTIEILGTSGSSGLAVEIDTVQDGAGSALIQFGSSLAVWLDDDAYERGYLAVGAPSEPQNGISGAGGIWIFRLDDGEWVFYRKLTDPLLASEGIGYGFGQFIDLDGTLLATGLIRDTDAGDNSGAAYIFRDWEFEQRLIPTSIGGNDLFGGGVSVSGSQVAVSSRRNFNFSTNSAGAVYVFEFDGSSWNQIQKITAPPADRQADGQFGRAVALRGDWLFIGAKRFKAGTLQGAAYIYSRADWTELRRLLPDHGDPTGQFGRFLVADKTGTRLLIGEPNKLVGGEDSAGIAHLYLNDGSWRYVQQIHPFGNNARNPRDFFGKALAVSETNALIGASNHAFNADGVLPLANAGAAWFYQILGEDPGDVELSDAVVCDGFAVLPIGLLDTAYASDDTTFITIPGGTFYPPQAVAEPPDDFTPPYDKIILRFRAKSVNGTIHAYTSLNEADHRAMFIDNTGYVDQFQIVWDGFQGTIDFSQLRVTFWAAPPFDVQIMAAELVIRKLGTPETSCLQACECQCQSAAEYGGTCESTCELQCQTTCEAYTETGEFEEPTGQDRGSTIQYELSGVIETNRCLGNSLSFLDAMAVLNEFLFDQRPIHVLPVYCVKIFDLPDIVGRAGEDLFVHIVGKFDDRVPIQNDELLIVPDCTQGCQVSCETFCEVGCEDNCQGIGPCENSCQLRCEAECQTDCEVVCQQGCVISCQNDSCQSFCQGACEVVCQSGCESNCQGACEIAGCQLSCTSGCEDHCEEECQVFCELQCQSTAEIGCATSCQQICQVCCQVECESACQQTCEVECQAACVSSCQEACQLQCQLSCELACQGSCEDAGCQYSCVMSCEGDCEEAGCQLTCQAGCQGLCEIICQIACESSGCQSGCEEDCESSGCQLSCEGTCQAACESDCQSSCVSICQESCEGSCQSFCEFNCQQSCQSSGCEVACEGACQSGCQNSCEATCEGASCQTTCEGSGCQSCCECQCQSTSCEASCTAACTSGCQISCEAACQAAGGCETSCEAACEGSNESCTTCCEICCEEYTEYGEPPNCQDACEGMGCQESCVITCQESCVFVSCQVSCTSASCQSSCMVTCQSSCTSGCQSACETANQGCGNSCELGCETPCESISEGGCGGACQSACQYGGGCQQSDQAPFCTTSCQAVCEYIGGCEMNNQL